MRIFLLLAFVYCALHCALSVELGIAGDTADPSQVLVLRYNLQPEKPVAWTATSNCKMKIEGGPIGNWGTVSIDMESKQSAKLQLLTMSTPSGPATRIRFPEFDLRIAGPIHYPDLNDLRIDTVLKMTEKESSIQQGERKANFPIAEGNKKAIQENGFAWPLTASGADTAVSMKGVRVKAGFKMFVNQLASAARLCFPKLPTEELTPGFTWEDTLDVSWAGLPCKLQAEYRYTGTEELDGYGRCARFEIHCEADKDDVNIPAMLRDLSLPLPPMRPSWDLLDIEVKGVSYFSLADDMIVKQTLQASLQGELKFGYRIAGGMSVLSITGTIQGSSTILRDLD